MWFHTRGGLRLPVLPGSPARGRAHGRPGRDECGAGAHRCASAPHSSPSWRARGTGPAAPPGPPRYQAGVPPCRCPSCTRSSKQCQGGWRARVHTPQQSRAPHSACAGGVRGQRARAACAGSVRGQRARWIYPVGAGQIWDAIAWSVEPPLPVAGMRPAHEWRWQSLVHRRWTALFLLRVPATCAVIAKFTGRPADVHRNTPPSPHIVHRVIHRGALTGSGVGPSFASQGSPGPGRTSLRGRGANGSLRSQRQVVAPLQRPGTPASAVAARPAGPVSCRPAPRPDCRHRLAR
jgi:hypothetical protein